MLYPSDLLTPTLKIQTSCTQIRDAGHELQTTMPACYETLDVYCCFVILLLGSERGLLCGGIKYCMVYNGRDSQTPKPSRGGRMICYNRKTTPHMHQQKAANRKDTRIKPPLPSVPVVWGGCASTECGALSTEPLIVLLGFVLCMWVDTHMYVWLNKR